MEKNPHVLLAGKGAEQFARQHGLPLVRNTYFNTQERREALRKGLKRHHGTVGAVALDRHGDLAAATSTGGYTGKLPGRVGDSPLIGAGNYADNAADRKSTRLNSSHMSISYAVFCLKKKKKPKNQPSCSKPPYNLLNQQVESLPQTRQS